jgi:capsular exopolysaccharide synthesis family protein
MGKTHEALLRAEKEYQKNILERSPSALSKKVVQLPRRLVNQAESEWYEDLKTNLLSRYPGKKIKRIMFNGIRHNGGCSRTAVNFAIALAKDSEFKVLLVDVNLRTPGLHEYFKIDSFLGLSNIVTDKKTTSSLIKKVGPGDLSILTCSEGYSVPLRLFESDKFDQFMTSMDKEFDYIILDAPPVPKYPECRVLCKKVDGVVLIVESEITRRQVALMAKKKLEDAGAMMLGVALNRRKFYIPEWLYSRL